MLKSSWQKSVLLLLVLISANGFLSAQNGQVQTYANSPQFAGIEVGSKGVKMSILVPDSNDADNLSLKMMKDTSINTDFISFTQPAYQATLAALDNLYSIARTGYHIPEKNIFTAISSGVTGQAKKEDKISWVNQLVNAFKLLINEPQRQVTLIDVTEEARLSHLGIVPDSKRYNTFLIDIGSGNTKGGYFPYGNTKNFKLFELTWGTKSTFNAADKMPAADKSLKSFNSNLSRVLEDAENNEIIYAVNLSGSFPKSDNIAFSGGIAWAVANLMAPELNDNPVVSVTYDEVKAFSEKLYQNPGLYSDYYIVKTMPANTVDLEKLAADIKQVNKVFDQRSLLAGTGLLLKIMRQFDGVVERKKFFLVKNGNTGWISAFANLNREK